MNKPEAIPQSVVDALVRYAKQHAPDEERTVLLAELLAALRWDAGNGCYFFIRAGMYHGVEIDGHVHT